LSIDAPLIKSDTSLIELSLRCVLLAVVLTVVLAMSNAYLALKIGILTSASIPAAILSMSVLKFFKNSNVLENNLVQTAASAGEAVAGGIVYTIPALIIIQYWEHFSYLENALIAGIGGLLGVLFSIPIRRLLVHEPTLPFPEGRAVAEVLKTSIGGSLYELVWGGIVGALLELCQTGFKVIANSYQVWFTLRRMIFGFGVGFSATLIGAGYLIGFELTLSIFFGAIMGWIVLVPLASHWYPHYVAYHSAADSVIHIWNAKIRYVGIGAMLFAGIWTFLKMLRPLIKSIVISFKGMEKGNIYLTQKKRTERDIPLVFLLILATVLSGVLFVFFQAIFPIESLGFNFNVGPTLVFISVLYVFIAGFVFATITGYFSGMVGVSASPGSSIIIAGMLIVAWALFTTMTYFIGPHLTSHQIKAAEAITIIIGSVVTGIAAIANDNLQDLKVGQLLGATPWKQELMLMLGVVVSALVIPPIMQLLFDVYGIAGVMPHPNMDPSQSLPAPPAALMAAITQAVFHHGLPWDMLLMGGLIILLFLPFARLIEKRFNFRLSALGIAIGIYLPMTSSIPLFIGGLIAFSTNRRLGSMNLSAINKVAREHRGLLLACGLVAGAALMDVLLAIPFSLARSPDVLKTDLFIWEGSTLGFAILSTTGVCIWFYHILCNRS
jgi:putative OPT family oligopeptide transporter